mgnify:CR=1 FL=1
MKLISFIFVMLTFREVLHAEDLEKLIKKDFKNIYTAVLERTEKSSEFGVDAVLFGRLKQESLRQLNLRADWKRLKHGQRALVFETNDNKIKIIIYAFENKQFSIDVAGVSRSLTFDELRKHLRVQ